MRKLDIIKSTNSQNKKRDTKILSSKLPTQN